MYARPEHSLHEGLDSRPLFCNPILIHLAIFIARGAFRDFKTVDEILNIEPPNDNEIFQLFWNPSVLDIPIYQRGDGKIESARTFSARLCALGFRTGYVNPPTTHDFRAEGLHLIGTFTR